MMRRAKYVLYKLQPCLMCYTVPLQYQPNQTYLVGHVVFTNYV